MRDFIFQIRAEWPRVPQDERDFIKVQLCIIATLATICASLLVIP